MKLHITGSPKWLCLVMGLQIMLVQNFLNLGTTVNNGKRWGSRNDPWEANLKRGEQSQSDWLLVHTNGFDGSRIHGMMFFFLMKEKDHRNERIRNQSSANKYLKMEWIIFQPALHLGNLCTCWLGFNPTVCWVLGSSKKFGRFLGYWRTISLVCLLLYRI